jgi:hypothetical protein
MGMSKKMVWIATSAMVVALIGLIGLQASLLGSALELKEQSFRQNVQAALADVSRSLETAETVTATLHVIGSNYQLMIQHGVDSAGLRVDTVARDTLGHVAVGVIPPPTLTDRDFASFKTYCDSIGVKGTLIEDSISRRLS